MRKKWVKNKAFHGWEDFEDKTCASVMAELGVPDKYAMERGGWSADSTLRNVYQHTFDEKRKQIDKQIDEYFQKLL